MSKNFKSGFTMIELMVVIIIIGILSSLAYAGMNALIQTNKAKEVAREITSFVERAIAEGKMRQQTVTISLNGSTLQAGETTKTLASGFSANTSNLPDGCVTNFNSGVTSENKIGISGVSGSGCFVACFGNYCGSAVKSPEKNKFVAKVKRPSTGWEDL
ncbi:MAG: prepilin-type N-terminal cleavage/methylation domain-containing protein [Candidatus Fibromonas sp.]|jgi:prepilin-type N-terminal cleavage/methylation domain-containing protein|nr:prepilin-type N-terminal cleavage/methylation domain-containing protein [Candidatus Fibromonas sp.]